MKRRLYHPWWAHLPAMGLIAATAIIFVQAAPHPLPEIVPIHFGAGGHANGFGGSWNVYVILFLLPLMFLALFVVGDEVWARCESRKRFNWLSLIDEALIGFFFTINVGYIETLRSGQNVLDMPWQFAILAGGGAVLFAAALERLRPFRPSPKPEFAGAAAVDPQLLERMRTGQPWVYWEIQNPIYINVVCVVGALACLWPAFNISNDSTMPVWSRVLIGGLLAAMALALMALLPAGLRISVGADCVRVKTGLAGLRLLRLKLNEIANVEVKEFSPLADYGGWGFRYNPKKGWAFFYRGRTGVRLETVKGKHYLLGSDDPQRLATVIRTAVEIAMETKQ